LNKNPGADLPKRHHEGEAGFFRRRTDGKRAFVGLCDLRSYVQAQAEPLPAGTNVAPEEWLKQFRHRILWYRLTGITNDQLENTAFCRCANEDGLMRSPVGHRIPYEVRDQLSYSRPVAIDWQVYRVFFRDLSPGRSETKFVDDLVQDRFKLSTGMPVKRNASSQPASREIKHVVN
jgi:hypothetical protein